MMSPSLQKPSRGSGGESGLGKGQEKCGSLGATKNAASSKGKISHTQRGIGSRREEKTVLNSLLVNLLGTAGPLSSHVLGRKKVQIDEEEGD